MNDITKGSISVTIYINLGFSATGIAAGSVTLSYWRDRGTSTTFAASALASETAAWVAGGWFEQSAANNPGIYRVDVPDAAWIVGTDGARSVHVGVKTATDFVVRNFLLSTIPNQVANVIPPNAAGSLGGLPTVDTLNGVKLSIGTATGQLNTDAGGNVKVYDYVIGKDPASYILANTAFKIATLTGGSVRVGDYDAGKDPGTYILVTPSQKIGTDAAHNVTVAAAGGTSMMVNGYAVGMSPAEQLLMAGFKINTDASGNVATAPVSLAAGAFGAIILDGIAFLDIIRGIAAGNLGEIQYDPATMQGTVAAAGNPSAIKLTFKSDANMLTRTNIALTLNS